MSKKAPLKVKKTFTIVEVLIAMSLFAVIITLLFSIFEKSCRINTQLKEKKYKHEKILFAQIRLQQIFSRSQLTKKTAKLHSFFTDNFEKKETSLIFTFDNGPDYERDFAGDVLAKLYINKENKLTLSYWPIPENPEECPSMMRNEFLLSDVQSLKMAFFTSSSKEKVKEVKPHWQETWEEDTNDLPLMMRVTVAVKNTTDQTNTHEFWILFNKQLGKITYNGGA